MLMSLIFLIVGLLIYAGLGPWGFVYLFFATVLSWAAGLVLQKHRWVLWPLIVLFAGSLLLYKLQLILGFQLLRIVGLSYFTLQILSYFIDVFCGKYPPERCFWKYALHITWLPHLWMGPIVPYDVMKPQLEQRRITVAGIMDGGRRALWGAFKLLVIGARAGVVVSAIVQKGLEGSFALVAMLLYSVQLYADFSGAMDVVLGISQMLGLQLPENFNGPFLSQSVREFWQRWHITLGAWLKAYVYIPLGGSRKGKIRKVWNLLLTFVVSGLWHGVHYLVWGLLQGILTACGEKLKTPIRWLNRLGTFLLVSLLWCFFIWPDMATALRMLLSVFATWNYGSCIPTLAAFSLTAGDWILLGLSAAAVFVYDSCRDCAEIWLRSRSAAGKTAVICALVLLILVFGMYGMGFDADSFIYSRF